MTSASRPPLEEVLARVERGSVARPLRVYFDLANYQSVAGNPSTNPLREKFEHCVGHGIVVPVLSFVHVIEIATKDAAHKESLIRLLAPLVDGHRVLWVRGTGDLRRREFHHAAANGGDGALPADVTFAPLWSDVTEQEGVPASMRGTQPDMRTLVDLAGRAAPMRYTHEAAEWVGASAYSRDRRARLPASNRPYIGGEIVARAMSYVPEDLAPEALMKVVAAPRWFDRLPALRLSLAYEEGNDLSEARIEPSDAEDAYHLGSAVYADIAFIDRRTVARLIAANACPDHLRSNADFEKLLDLVTAPPGAGASPGRFG